MISVIVPVYDTSKYLHKCLDSIICQSYSDLEIIVVDDGSNDGSENICDEYACRDTRIKVIHKENGGLVSARKAGIAAATADLIGFVDSDDWIEPDMYEKLYEALTKSDADISMCGRFEEYTNRSRNVYHGIDEGVYKGDDLINKVFPRMIMNGLFFEWGIFPSYWDKLFKRDAIEKYLLSVDDRIIMGEDAAGVFPCLLNVHAICVIHECLYHYRQSQFSMVRRKGDDVDVERERFRILYNSTRDWFIKGKDIYDFADQWRKYILFLMMPRADVLYKDVFELGYLFPFPNIKSGDDIIIYGAGVWGQRLYRVLKDNRFCNVVAIADINYRSIQLEEVKVISPSDIANYSYDAIVVTVSYAHVREQIMDDLSQRYPEAQIYLLDQKEVFSSRTWSGFGLEQGK